MLECVYLSWLFTSKYEKIYILYVYTNARINITNHYLKYCGDGLARSFGSDWIEKLRPKEKKNIPSHEIIGRKTYWFLKTQLTSFYWKVVSWLWCSACFIILYMRECIAEDIWSYCHSVQLFNFHLVTFSMFNIKISQRRKCSPLKYYFLRLICVANT